ncbi:MAG TPA: hypothetical protein DDY16_09640 [Tenacibaculum sp.]|nr:hypothetical protein [Tenacibaculum sp.]
MKTFKKINLFLFIIFYSTLYSQELETILLAKDDAQKLTKAYLNPSFKGLIFAMNNGWYHTAKVHEKFGFDISIGANFTNIPSKKELFSIAELGLSNNTTVINGATSSPTVAGSNSISPAQFQYSTQIEGQNVSANFSLNTYTIQAIASLNFPVLNVFGGIGYNGGDLRLNTLGNYTLNYNTSINGAPNVEESITDPFSIKTNSGSMNATIGARVSLGFFKLYGSYSLQEYNTINAGIAFSFR